MLIAIFHGSFVFLCLCVFLLHWDHSIWIFHFAHISQSMVSSMHLIQLITVRWIFCCWRKQNNKQTNKNNWITEKSSFGISISVSMTLYHRYIKRYIIHSFISSFVTFTMVINLKSDDDKMSTVVHRNESIKAVIEIGYIEVTRFSIHCDQSDSHKTKSIMIFK